MNELITIIIFSILFISIYIYYQNNYSELIYVKSNVDDTEYLVRNRDDKVEAANMLANIKKKLLELVYLLEIDKPNDKKIQRLVKKFNPKNIQESISGTKHTSYSVNKGEKIVFCIRAKNKKQQIVDLNTMLFVAIHELAHIMTLSIGHTEEFWNNMRFLLKFAIKKKIYKKQNFQKKPVSYCGITITDSPLN
jgi:predicted metal-dependent hydrolase